MPDPARRLSALTSIPLLGGLSSAILLEVAILFGLPVLPWLIIAVFLLVAGSIIGWIVTEDDQHGGSHQKRRIEVASLSVATLSLVVAAVTFVLQFDLVR